MRTLVICFIFLCFGVNTNEETITWNESRRLSWKDFKAEPIENYGAVALTASGITFGYSVKTQGNRIIGFTTSVEAHFYPNKSWYLKNSGNAYILSHEQLHFDITELYARKFRQQLERLVVNQNIKEQLNRLHKTINEAVNETQKRYDEQTNHSINKNMQEQWQTYIQGELQKLDAYKSR